MMFPLEPWHVTHTTRLEFGMFRLDPDPEIIPYGKRSPWRNTIWETFPRKKFHDRTSPGGETIPYGKASPLYGKSLPHTHTNFMMREQIPWQIVPPEIIRYMANVPHEGIPYGKPSPGRNPMAELPQISSSTNSICNIGSQIFLRGGGGINPIDGELLRGNYTLCSPFLGRMHIILVD